MQPDIQAELKAAVTVIMDTATYLISGSRNPTPRITPPGTTSPAEREKEIDRILAIYSHHGHGHVPQLLVQEPNPQDHPFCYYGSWRGRGIERGGRKAEERERETHSDLQLS